MRNFDTAIEAYYSADVVPAVVEPKCWDLPWNMPQSDSLQVFILEEIPESFVERDIFIQAMESVGYRMMEFSELVALGIERSDLIKKNGIKYLYGLHEYLDHEYVQMIPFLGYNSTSGERFIDATDETEVDKNNDRFLFIKCE